MQIPRKIAHVLDVVEKKTEPISIFLYGSRARTDSKEDSDFEIGILYKSDNRWRRQQLAELHSIEQLHLYSFNYEDFVAYSPDTPFPKSVFLRELLTGGAKTLRGERTVEKTEPPEIKLSDLLETAAFQSAYSLAALLSSRQVDWITTAEEFTKSVFFGARVLIILEQNRFPLTYAKISEQFLTLELENKYNRLMKHAATVRAGAAADVDLLYVNISFQNQVITKKIRKEIQKGDKIILQGKSI